MITLDKEEELWHIEEVNNKLRERIISLESFIKGKEPSITIKGVVYDKHNRPHPKKENRFRKRA